MNELNDFKKRTAKIRKLKNEFLKISKEKTLPLYIYDSEEVKTNIRRFKNAFKNEKTEIGIFYAIKSNPYIGLLKTVVEEGECLDASSQRELKLALKAGAKRIIYTGPAKTEEDFELIIKNHKKITVNLDSFNEIRLLGKILKNKKINLRCGVRIYTKNQKGWTKFGIPLGELKDFHTEAKKYKNIDFCGIHFHISFNRNPEKYIQTLKEISGYFRNNFSEKEIKEFKFMDIGGGFYPEAFEGEYPWNKEQTVYLPGNEYAEVFEKIISDEIHPRFIPVRSEPIESFAKQISSMLKKEIFTILPNIKIYAEPGRFISHSSMHIMLKVIDSKNEKSLIVDGGTNMLGYEKYQFLDYVPVFNLTRFSDTLEIPTVVYGSLCTPDDIWGYYIYGTSKPKIGDILLLPFQGAYTYTLAQEFIKGIPKVHYL